MENNNYLSQTLGKIFIKGLINIMFSKGLDDSSIIYLEKKNIFYESYKTQFCLF